MKRACVLLLCLILCSCATNKPLETVRLVTKDIYPAIPPIEPVSDAPLVAWQYDFPRDTSAPKIVKTTENCKKLSVKYKSVSQYPDYCLEYPIAKSSNLFIGLTYDNWVILTRDFMLLKQQYLQYKARIDAINKQRSDWINLNNKGD